MKVLAWAILLLLSSCFCASFYAQQMERRAQEVRRTMARPDSEWQQLLREDDSAECVDPPTTQPSVAPASAARDVAAADGDALPY